MRRVLAVMGLVACAGAPREGSFSALTYNVQGLPDALTDSDSPTAQRMAEISPLLEAYDVVGLQESFDPEWHALLVSATTHPVREHFAARVEPERVYGSGLGLLARVGEPVGYEAFHYAACHGTLDGASDCLASKGLQVQRLELGRGAALAVLNTHHEAGGGPEDDAARGAQVEQVIAWLAAHPDDAVLFVGDLNLRPSDPPDAAWLERYAEAGLRDACDEVGCPEPDHIDHLLVRDGASLRLDVIAWSSEAQFVEADGDPLSDHPALAIEVGWAR